MISSSSSRLLLDLSVVLIIGFVSISRSTDASAIRYPRWVRPCGGGEPAPVGSPTPNNSGSETMAQNTGVVSNRANERTHLTIIKNIADSLSTTTRRLKQKYMEHNRFVNNNEAQIILRTYPGPPLPNLLSPLLTASETDITLMAAFDSLARLSLYIELAKRGEANAENQRRSLDADYDEIENDPSIGLYTLLCHIRRAMTERGINLSRAAENEIRLLNVVGSQNRLTHSSIRHSEDYVTLHVFEQLLNDLVVCANRLMQTIQ